MSIKEYLDEIKKYEYTFKKAAEKIDEVRTAGEKVTAGSLDGMPRGSMTSDKVSEAAAEITDLMNEFILQYADWFRRYHEIREAINELPANCAIALTKRYLEYKKPAQIAAEMNYSERHVMRFIDEGVAELEGKINVS